MPEYLAPGVYIEETSFRSKSIEGVSTTTTGFVGPARFGPVTLEPDIITSLEDFERIYGDGQQLRFQDPDNPTDPTQDTVVDNFLWHAVRAFFIEGGKRLYIARTFKPITDDQGDSCTAKGYIRQDEADTNSVEIQARFPGSGGNARLRVTARMGRNVLSGDKGSVSASGIQNYDVVWLTDISSPYQSPLNLGSPVESPWGSPFESPLGWGDFYLAIYDKDEKTWRFGKSKTKDAANDIRLNSTDTSLRVLDPDQGHEVHLVTLTLTLIDEAGKETTWADLPLDPEHEHNGVPDSLAARFPETSALSPGQARGLPIVITLPSGMDNGIAVLNKIIQVTADASIVKNDPTRNAIYAIEVRLKDGKDGLLPTPKEYEGTEDPDTDARTGLKALEGIEDISIVAAPGSTYGMTESKTAYKNAFAIQGLLIAHATNLRYRIAVLDSGNDMSIAEVRDLKGMIDSKYAALYYPWVRILDPITSQEIVMPPSGFVTGIYARNDITRAVYKAPANEVVNLSIGFEKLLNKSQQDVLNPEGVNCFRFFEGRGFRLWGARTTSSDPEWKYVNLRRYFAYLEHSIDRGTQWAVFEPNGEALWDNVRRTIDSFLFNEWQNGALLGDKPEKAYFVKCDRSTMTQNDLDNGRLVCLIGVAPLRPAEYVIFRIGQWTADAKR